MEGGPIYPLSHSLSLVCILLLPLTPLPSLSLLFPPLYSLFPILALFLRFFHPLFVSPFSVFISSFWSGWRGCCIVSVFSINLAVFLSSVVVDDAFDEMEM